jgi:hypothetical protein
MHMDAERLAVERDTEVPAVDERTARPPGRSGDAEGSHRRKQVLNIIVVDDEHAEDATRFAFKERVSAPLLEDPHFRAQLIQRVAWAVADAELEDEER